MDALTSLDPGNDAEIRALLILEQIDGVGLRKLRALVSAFGTAARALSVGSTAFKKVTGRAIDRRASLRARHSVDEGLHNARRLEMAVISWASDSYPPKLLQLADPPPVLFLRGRSELLSRPGITVVGARRATTRGKDVAERLGLGIARSGLNVVSGMALGIDGAAHRGALRAGSGGTVAVLGRGADEAYPSAHRTLFQRIIDEGLVVSEFLPGTPPLPHHFPRRNRILAALGEAVVVVEAGARSGSLITVDHALDLGVDVWAVPGPIDSPSCTGSNRLLRDGAAPLVSVPGFLREVAGAELEPRRETGPLHSSVSEVLTSLDHGPLHVDALAERAGLPVPQALVLLAEMELTGSVEQLPGLRFRKAS